MISSSFTPQKEETETEYIEIWFSMYTLLNHRDVRRIIGIEDVLTTKVNGDGEQAGIE